MMSAKLRNSPTLCITALLLWFVPGCGPRTHPVGGKVTFADGSVLKAGVVLFNPLDEENKKASCRGFIREDGTYQMGTFEDTDGVFEGKYEVAVTAGYPPNPDRPPPDWPPLNKRFSNFATSGLRYTVVAGTNKLDIAVEK